MVWLACCEREQGGLQGVWTRWLTCSMEEVVPCTACRTAGLSGKRGREEEEGEVRDWSRDAVAWRVAADDVCCRV